MILTDRTLYRTLYKDQFEIPISYDERDPSLIQEVHTETYRGMFMKSMITSYGGMTVFVMRKQYDSVIEMFDNILAARKWIDIHIQGLI